MGIELCDAMTRRLAEAALQARENAYCPYSGFAVGAALLTADGKLVAPIGAEGFLVHLGDHDWVLSGFAAARCVAYLRDYAKRSFGTLPEARFNALRNYVGSRVSYMRLYQDIAQGRADALVASVVKA